MGSRLYSRLLLWNLLIIALVSFTLAFFLPSSQLAYVVLIAVSTALISVNLARILISRPLHKMVSASKILASGRLDGKLLAAGTDEIAELGTSLNAMAQNLSHAIRELTDAKQRLEGILAAMGHGVMVLDRSGRVRFTNAALHEILGTERDLSGKTALEVFRRPELNTAVHIVLNHGPRQTLEITTGDHKVLQASVVPVLGSSKEVAAVVVSFHDMTDTRRTERMRRDFIANVSHEFKTPLTSIRGYAETLLSGAKDDPALATDFLKIIERNAGHLEALVSDLLTLARLEAEVPAIRQIVDVKALIEEQVALRQRSLNEAQIDVVMECDPVEIHADPSRLSTALSNLIDNAIQYNKPGGAIRISAGMQNGTLSIAVADTGYGIPSAELYRIFERFYRVDKARSRESGGTGLGLSIVKHAIESQGGAISVTSRLGAGSTFTIRLPISQASASM